MYRDLSVAVVVPAFNEERAVGRAVREVPEFVDHVVVVDDASGDTTALEAARAGALTGQRCWQDSVAWASDPGQGNRGRALARSFEVIRHGKNRGVGAAIVTGYQRVLARHIDVAVVMAGDGQMDPGDLPALLDPIADGRADYAKGNRFLHRDVWRVMPRTRLVGNLLLSCATRLTSGYWQVFDSQCGYTAIHRRALERIELDRVFPRYGYPNDLLARLHAAGMQVVDVPVRPVYGPDWHSGIKLHTVIYPVAFVLLRSWLMRLNREFRARWSRALPEPGSSAEDSRMHG